LSEGSGRDDLCRAAESDRAAPHGRMGERGPGEPGEGTGPESRARQARAGETVGPGRRLIPAPERASDGWTPCEGRPETVNWIEIMLTKVEDTAGPEIYRTPEGPIAAANDRIGVLLLNLGTPDGTDYWSMRRYLKEFLSDERVIEEPRWKWWPILNLIILTVRPGRKGRDYATIWNTERDEGPLKTISRAQAEMLAKRLAAHPKVVVDWAMRYANPTTASRIEALVAAGCDRILLVPLYPQYAAATTATAADQAF